MKEKLELEIVSKLQNQKFEIAVNVAEPNGKHIAIGTPTSLQHKIIIRFLNLDEARYIKIHKLDFNLPISNTPLFWKL